jgi:hypothetical protein
MRWALCILLTVGLLGCPGDDDDSREPVWTNDDDWGDDDDSSPAGDDDDTTPPVPDAVLFEPADGEVGVSPSRAVIADFKHEGAIGEITLTDENGSSVPGRTLQSSLQRLLFLSDDLLAPSTTYEATVIWPTGEASWSFTTSTSGATPVSILPTGLTLHWTLTSSVVSPPGAQVFLSIADLQLLTQITHVSGDELRMLGAVVVDGVQDLCAPTFDPTGLEVGRYADPTFRVGPTSFTQLIDLSILGFGMVQIPFRDAQLAGVLLDDGDGNYVGVESGRFVGVIDARDLNIPNACDTLGSVGLPCVTCPFDLTSEACVVFVLDDLTTTLEPDITLQERSVQDILDDPACQ